VSLPRGQYGAYPTYTVTADDSLETIAFKVFGDPARYPDIIRIYDLYPPYIASAAPPLSYWNDGSTWNGGGVWGDVAALNSGKVLKPGSQLVLPNDEQSVSYEEAFGLNWVIDEQNGRWDWAVRPDGGIEEVGGLGALEVSLFARVSQPLDDWMDADTRGYGVPNVVIGRNITNAAVQRFALTQALLQDDRVLDVQPNQDSIATANGYVFDNLTINVKVPEGLLRNYSLQDGLSGVR
jgi:hypothetical protein